MRTVGIDSGCPYSCGEVEIAARLRGAGFEAHWISEWSGFAHVPAWEPFCIKRIDFSTQVPVLWRFDQELRTAAQALGRSGGHPDVACLTPEGPVYLEYKGPNDSIKAKQNAWAAAVIERESPRLVYLALHGAFRPATALDPLPISIVTTSPARERIARDTGTTAGPAPATPIDQAQGSRRRSTRRPKLDPRTISDTLKREQGWSVMSHVDGSIDCTLPRSSTSIHALADEVRRAVEAMGYVPTVRVARDRSGRSVVRDSPPRHSRVWSRPAKPSSWIPAKGALPTAY
jgi:hypothetical protein